MCSSLAALKQQTTSTYSTVTPWPSSSRGWSRVERVWGEAGGDATQHGGSACGLLLRVADDSKGITDGAER